MDSNHPGKTFIDAHQEQKDIHGFLFLKHDTQMDKRFNRQGDYGKI